jgi:hypothetical protein
MLVASISVANISRGCAIPMIARAFLLTRPHRFANRVPSAPVAARKYGTDNIPSAPFSRSCIFEELSHKLINVVVVTVLDARADAPGPCGPQAVAEPTFAEGGHPSGRPVGGISCVEGAGEFGVLEIYLMIASRCATIMGYSYPPQPTAFSQQRPVGVLAGEGEAAVAEAE